MSRKSLEKPSVLANYKDLFERMLDPIFLVEPETLQIKDANPATERILGFSMETLTDKTLDQLIPEACLEEFKKILRVVKRRYYPREHHLPLITRSGKEIQADISACMLEIPNHPDLLQIITRDVTLEKKAQGDAKRYLEDLLVANKRLEELSLTDELTEIANKRHFNQELAMEAERARRYKTPYALVFCDVDHFKFYNDRNGHPAGDEVLKKLGLFLNETCRNTDLAARYGGEEFIILCRGVDWKGAKIMAERIQEKLAKEEFPFARHQPLGKISLSMGVSSFPEDGNNLQDVLKAADDSLYCSKQEGRDQIHAHQENQLEKAS